MAENTIENLICTTEKECQAVIEWFKCNETIENFDKFQAIIVKRNSKLEDSYPLFIDSETANFEKNVKLLGCL